MQVSKVSTNKTRTLALKSFARKMKLKFPKMNCSFKTNQALLCTQPEV